MIKCFVINKKKLFSFMSVQLIGRNKMWFGSVWLPNCLSK
jgi:hypothetical protein